MLWKPIPPRDPTRGKGKEHVHHAVPHAASEDEMDKDKPNKHGQAVLNMSGPGRLRHAAGEKGVLEKIQRAVDARRKHNIGDVTKVPVLWLAVGRHPEAFRAEHQGHTDQEKLPDCCFKVQAGEIQLCKSDCLDKCDQDHERPDEEEYDWEPRLPGRRKEGIRKEG